MKKRLFLLLVLLPLHWSNVQGEDYTNDFNPDGKIGSFVFTVGGAVGFGSMEEDFFSSTYEPEKFNRSSYSFLCRIDHPASKRLTFSVQVEYLNDKIATAGIYEGTSSGFQIGTYFKFFSR